MKYHNRNVGVLAFLVLLTLLVGCASNASGGASHTPGSQSPCEKPSNIRGTIVSIKQAPAGSSTNSLATILIDGTREPQAAYDKVYISLHVDTQVFEKQGQACHSVSSASLKIGQRVQVQPATGLVLQTYPPQLTASEIIILSPGN